MQISREPNTIAGDSPYRHYNFVDGVRGIAACLVMLQHSMENAGIEILDKQHFALALLNLGEVGVVAFFFVSGFVIPLSLEKWNSVPHFLINRVFRIYPLYICAYFATAALAAPLGFWFAQLPANFVLHLFFAQGLFSDVPNFVGVAWTLGLEAVWYAGFTLLFAIGINKNLPALLGLSAIGAMAGCALSLTNVVRIPMGRLSLLLVCVGGLLSLRRDQKDISHRTFIFALAILTVTVGFGLYVGFFLRPSSSPIAPTFPCVAISWSLGGALFFIPFFYRTWVLTNNAISRYLGKISYSIYLLHPLVISVVTATFAHTVISGWYLVALIAIGTIMLSSLTYRFIEFPMISLSHALRPARKASP